MKQNSFFNTTGETGESRKLFENKARSQEDRILDLFIDFPRIGLTPTEAQRNLVPCPPITSVRRALSNLTSRGDLIKTAEQKLGPYRRPEHVWKLNQKESQS